MGLPRGRTIPLSPARRLVCDAMHASRHVPLVAIERHCNLSKLIETRATLEARPSWFAIFLKAYAIVSKRREELRRSYLSFPWPRLHQHDCNVAALPIIRRLGDEDYVLTLQIRRPEEKTLGEIDELVRRARTEPVEQFGDFRRLLRMSRMPRFVRRFAWWMGLCASGQMRARFAGTFGITGVAALGSTSLSVLSPLTTTITYGVFTDQGTTPVRLFFDHRVLDGVETARALEELEQTLQGSILDEMCGAARRAA